MENKSFTLTLTNAQLIDLSLIVGDNLDNIQYLLEEEIKQGDPNEEVESLTDQVLETRDLLILLEKTLNPTPIVLGMARSPTDPWYCQHSNHPCHSGGDLTHSQIRLPPISP